MGVGRGTGLLKYVGCCKIGRHKRGDEGDDRRGEETREKEGDERRDERGNTRGAV